MSAIEIVDLPRERFITHGGDRVTTAELLALILGTGMRGRSATAVAQHLLYRIGGIAKLALATPRELVTIPGIGAARAARVAAAFHLSRRAMEASLAEAGAIHDPVELHDMLRIRMSGLAQEVFLVIALDARNAVFDQIEVARGCLTGVEVHPREVFRPLIRQSAATAVVAHNHPSGDPTPSHEDVALTYRLHEAGQLIGIPIIDHIIVGAHSCTSLYGYLGIS